MRDVWQEVLAQFREESIASAPARDGKSVLRFRFDRSWVRYWERTNLSTIRNIGGRSVYEPLEKQVATISVDGADIGRIDVESPVSSLALKIENGEHIFNISMTVVGGQTLRCRDDVVFGVGGSSAYEVTATLNKNYASPQNAMICQLKKTLVDR